MPTNFRLGGSPFGRVAEWYQRGAKRDPLFLPWVLGTGESPKLALLGSIPRRGAAGQSGADLGLISPMGGFDSLTRHHLEMQ